jgi:hypothetical protein
MISGMVSGSGSKFQSSPVRSGKSWPSSKIRSVSPLKKPESSICCLLTLLRGSLGVPGADVISSYTGGDDGILAGVLEKLAA